MLSHLVRAVRGKYKAVLYWGDLSNENPNTTVEDPCMKAVL